MVDRDEAEAIVVSHLRSIESSDCRFAISACDELRDGWIFYYDSARYLETGEVFEQLAGNGPLVVHRDSGVLTELVTYRSIETQIEEWERAGDGEGSAS